MRYTLIVDGLQAGYLNQIELPAQFGDFFGEQLAVFVDGVEVYTEVTLLTGIAGAYWDESSDPEMTEVGEFVTTVVFYLNEPTNEIEIGFKETGAVLPVAYSYGADWDESSDPEMTTTTTPDTNTSTTVMWWGASVGFVGEEAVQGLAWNDDGIIRYIHKVFINEGGILKECRVVVNLDGVIHDIFSC